MSNKCPTFGDNDIRNCPCLCWKDLTITLDKEIQIPVCCLNPKKSVYM